MFIQQQLEKYEDAIETYSKAIEIKPSFFEVYINLAIVQQELERYYEAEVS